MKISIRIKKLISNVVHSLGVDKRVQRRANNSTISVLMYHRVIPVDEANRTVQAGMYVTPETFDNHMEYLKEAFSVEPMTVLLRNHRPHDIPEKPLCVITFDDGWQDIYKNAFPVLKKYNAPATVFLPTDFIGTSRWFWTDRLAHLFIQHGQSEVSARTRECSAHALVNKLEDLQGSVESRTEEAIAMLKACHSEQIESVLSELSTRWAAEPVPQGRAFLSWDEVREMRSSGLVTFGSHTASHRILTMLTEEEVREELVRSRERLVKEHAADASFIPFCYPNGNYNDNTVRCVEETGYDLAVTTERGWNLPGPDQFTLKRIGLHQDITSSAAMLRCRIAGLL